MELQVSSYCMRSSQLDVKRARTLNYWTRVEQTKRVGNGSTEKQRYLYYTPVFHLINNPLTSLGFVGYWL